MLSTVYYNTKAKTKFIVICIFVDLYIIWNFLYIRRHFSEFSSIQTVVLTIIYYVLTQEEPTFFWRQVSFGSQLKENWFDVVL